MAFEQLLAWAAGRPAWQQDALRRLAQSGELTEEDLSALRLQIETQEDLTAVEIPEPAPLAAEHLTEAASNEPRTVLASLGPTRHVDRLASDQPPIRFALNGITLIYGPNAAGKSGYCRIMKQLCRSLSPVDLRGNIYEAPSGVPEVAVAFRVGGNGEPKMEITWVKDDPPPSELARISIFDTASARVYVDKERKIEFLPYELDLLNQLGLGCRSLDQGFRNRETALNTAINTPLPTGYMEGTEVYQAIEKLVTATALDQLPSEQELRDLGDWSDEKQGELDAAVQALNSDPNTLVRLRREAKQALESIKDEVTTVTNNLGDPAIVTIQQKQQDAKIKSDTAEASAKDMFKDQPIPDVGSEVWRQMLTYAREFATVVFPECDPPQLATGGKCVLCQQDLDEMAAERMAAFDGYLAERAAEDAAAATREFEECQAVIHALSCKSKRDIETILAGYAALSEDRKQNAGATATFFEKAGERLQSLKLILREKLYDDLKTLDPLPDSPAQILENEIAMLDGEIAELEGREHDADAMTRLALRHAELTDQKRLGEGIQIIVDHRNKLEERHRVLACRRQCRLTAITRQITERRREILTPSLKEALTDELNTLGLTHIPLNLSDRGEIGESIIEVALSAQQRIANNSEVLSEGEQRALALACFLAELAEIGRDHGIIVDDPVSSLDHTRMQAVAERLAEEAAKGRQVIVFTHNILFHHMLVTEARRAGVACHREWMTNLGNDQFGIIDDSQKPWQMKAVSERLHDIGQAHQALEPAGYDHTDESFRETVVDLYTKMRMTWERVIEEILFNRVVQRFRLEIMTQSLRAACVDPENDYPVIFEGMKRCSHYSGHDPADDLPPELPTLKHITRDVEALRDFATHASKRRKELEKTMGSYEDGITPELI